MDFHVLEFDSLDTNFQSYYIKSQYKDGWELISVIRNPEFKEGVIMYFKKPLKN